MYGSASVSEPNYKRKIKINVIQLKTWQDFPGIFSNLVKKERKKKEKEKKEKEKKTACTTGQNTGFRFSSVQFS